MDTGEGAQSYVADGERASLNIAAQETVSALREYASFLTRRVGTKMCGAFGSTPSSGMIDRIYVINLDRKPDRWQRICRELNRVLGRDGQALGSLTRRRSAVDGRYLTKLPVDGSVAAEYSLAEQLYVHPIHALSERTAAHDRLIPLTPQEVAVACSHLEVWKEIAHGSAQYALVLEDDVYFGRGFARVFDAAWLELMASEDVGCEFDMLYVSYKEANGHAQKRHISENLFQPLTGLWQLSGYVLSRRGARRLLELLPVRGPIDLWINHKFQEIDVFATRRPVIRQRPDTPSTNSYSVLPVLSEVGVLTHEKPLLMKTRELRSPVFAYGAPEAGLASLAMALSMIGYRCCSDVDDLPLSEKLALWQGRRRVFDAYVNVGSLPPTRWLDLARRYPDAGFIVAADGLTAAKDTSPKPNSLPADLPGPMTTGPALNPANVLVLPIAREDKWQLLTDFLRSEYPEHLYPRVRDRPSGCWRILANLLPASALGAARCGGTSRRGLPIPRTGEESSSNTPSTTSTPRPARMCVLPPTRWVPPQTRGGVGTTRSPGTWPCSRRATSYARATPSR